jgi:hypothetical protein
MVTKPRWVLYSGAVPFEYAGTPSYVLSKEPILDYAAQLDGIIADQSLEF